MTTTLTTTFKCGGKEHAVTTVQEEDESDADFVARHKAAVAAYKAIHCPE